MPTTPPPGGDVVLIVGPPRAAEAPLRAAYPNLPFDILPAPAGLARDAALRLAVARACMKQPWDILLLCVGCPAQELIAAEIAALGRNDGVALCVGAAIDFLTGVRVRARNGCRSSVWNGPIGWRRSRGGCGADTCVESSESVAYLLSHAGHTRTRTLDDTSL